MRSTFSFSSPIFPTKLMSRQANEIEEEFLRPNVSEALHAKISDWATFVRAFEAMDVETLKGFPPFLDELVWEREYRTVAWKEVPYRKMITEFLKLINLLNMVEYDQTGSL